MGVEIAGVDLREELSETVIHEIRPVVQHLYRHIENLNFHARVHLSKNSDWYLGQPMLPTLCNLGLFPCNASRLQSHVEWDLSELRPNGAFGSLS